MIEIHQIEIGKTYAMSDRFGRKMKPRKVLAHVPWSKGKLVVVEMMGGKKRMPENLPDKYFVARATGVLEISNTASGISLALAQKSGRPEALDGSGRGLLATDCELTGRRLCLETKAA